MKKKYCFICLIVIVIISGTKCFAQLKELQFRKFGRSSKDDTLSLSGIKAIIKVDTIQSRSDRGLVFSLRLKNTTSNSVEIMNPLDFLGIDLFNESRQSVLIQEGLPRYEVRDPNEKFNYRQFEIEQVKINNSVVDFDISQKKSVVLQANESIEIFIGIVKIINKNRNEQPIISGKYKIDIGVIIVKANNGVQNAEDKGQLLHIDRTAILYK
jgi:hypothetical protein